MDGIVAISVKQIFQYQHSLACIATGHWTIWFTLFH